MTVIFDGRKLAEEKLAVLKPRVLAVKKRLGRPPKIVVLMVGENKASRIYVNEKKEAAEKAGIDFELVYFSSTVNVEEVIEKIKEANEEQSVDGVMVQLPIEISNFKLQISNYKSMSNVKCQMSKREMIKKFHQKILDEIAPGKDVDCLTEENLELVRVGKPRYLPGTVKAIVEIISNFQFPISNFKTVVVGDRGFVGKPLMRVLKNMGLEVRGANSETENLAELTRRADVLISATGRPGLIKAKMVKEGAMVIDVGYPQADVDFEEIKNKASFVTPVPGGVGPVTVACLLENLVVAAERKLR